MSHKTISTESLQYEGPDVSPVAGGRQACAHQCRTVQRALRTGRQRAGKVRAVHAAVFGGFSADSRGDRINDPTCRVLIPDDSPP